MTDLTRRSLLAAAGAAVATAGCLTAPGEPPAATDSDEPPDATDPGETTGETPRTESRERETTDSTATDAPDETTGDWVTHASNEPDPDHAVTLANRSDASETVRVRVVREETGETVFEATETVDPGVELDLYNVEDADPEGIEGFEICGELVESGESTGAETPATDETDATERTTTASDRRDCATIRTNGCYANAHVTVDGDGSLRVIYAIC